MSGKCMCIQVSAEPPFEIKQAIDGLLNALPANLREFIMMKKTQSHFGKVHRFWIENDEIPYYEHVDGDGVRTYEFYYTPMLVKKHLMKQNSDVSKIYNKFYLSYSFPKKKKSLLKKNHHSTTG